MLYKEKNIFWPNFILGIFGHFCLYNHKEIGGNRFRKLQKMHLALSTWAAQHHMIQSVRDVTDAD